MQPSPVGLIAEDDEGHAILIQQTPRDAGLRDRVWHFIDGQAIVDFLFRRGPGPHREANQASVPLLDIRVPQLEFTLTFDDGAIRQVLGYGESLQLDVMRCRAAMIGASLSIEPGKTAGARVSRTLRGKA